MQASGYTGAGTTVCVLDSGVDFARAAFGSCSAPGIPAGCKLVAAVDMAANDGMLHDPALGRQVPTWPRPYWVSHRTHSSNNILTASNWCITNCATDNIVAIKRSSRSARICRLTRSRAEACASFA